MRVVKMGYTQRVTKKDKKGRITSSFVRVRIVVPDGLSPSLPKPYTGTKNLTKKTSTDREAAEWTARFLAIIDQAAGRCTALNELIGLDSFGRERLRVRRLAKPGIDPASATSGRKVLEDTRPSHPGARSFRLSNMSGV
jgi:hypothetical protein